MPFIGRQPTIGNFQVCDAISVVNNQAAYTMQVGGVNVSPESSYHMIVSLNGVIQNPKNSFILIPLPVRMRTAPTSITQTGSASDYTLRTVTSDTCTDVPTFSSATPLNVMVTFKNSGHGFGTAVIVQGQINSANSFIGVNAEL